MERTSHLSADGGALYYTARTGAYANVFRLLLNNGGKAEVVTDLSRHAHDGLVSPDGKWLAFRRNTEIWLARMQPRVLTDQDFHRFSSQGGRSFAFTPDSSAIVYSEGPRVWRQGLERGRAAEIPVDVRLHRAVTPPVLLGKSKPHSAPPEAMTRKTGAVAASRDQDLARLRNRAEQKAQALKFTGNRDPVAR